MFDRKCVGRYTVRAVEQFRRLRYRFLPRGTLQLRADDGKTGNCPDRPAGVFSEYFFVGSATESTHAVENAQPWRFGIGGMSGRWVGENVRLALLRQIQRRTACRDLY